ncbi:MAG TPA: tetratricopeptide repeat protein [Wenzhouxiangella sp.]|nr:tetratricopeptide repeat protein [Wenzhouxiangella sp.]
MTSCRLLLIFLLCVATGCATQAPAPVDERIADEQVRAPAAEQARGLQVFALRNPAVTDLSEAAREAESSDDLNRAAMLLERALRIEPRDPELLQQMAELRLDQGRWQQAESHARRSFDVGPRVGELCQRNWRTVAVAMERQNQPEAARSASERLQACQIEAPPRL